MAGGAAQDFIRQLVPGLFAQVMAQGGGGQTAPMMQPGGHQAAPGAAPATAASPGGPAKGVGGGGSDPLPITQQAGSGGISDFLNSNPLGY